MTTPINDGGPIHPCQPLNAQGDPMAPMHPGMSLRDYFAGLAMQALISKFPAEETGGGVNKTDVMTARGAYCLADAMIEVREAKL